jgi:hypothetical protein
MTKTTDQRFRYKLFENISGLRSAADKIRPLLNKLFLPKPSQKVLGAILSRWQDICFALLQLIKNSFHETHIPG